MTENTRRKLTPEEYIRKLYSETENGLLKINYFPFLDQPYSHTYKMSWKEEAVEETVNEYSSLAAALSHIGKLNISDEEEAKSLLPPREFMVWSTFIRPFEPFETDLDTVTQLSLRSETETLADEEYELLERHYDWYAANSRKRLTFINRCPSFFINRAQRYEALVRANAPQTVIREEGRFLAEEMVLYNYALEKLS